MPLAKYDDVVKAFSPDRADQLFTYPFCHGDRGVVIPKAHRPKASDEDLAVDTVPIANEIAWPLLPDISLRQLATYPFGAWMRGCPEPASDIDAAVVVDSLKSA